GFDEPQLSNWSAKGDRLASLPQEAAAVPVSTFTLASLPPEPAPQPEPVPPAAEAEQPAPVVALPSPKPNRPPLPSNAILDDPQIASIKARLRLTPDQLEYWPGVEAALRDVARLQARESRKHPGHGQTPQLDVNSQEVQRLIYAAMPLIGQLREDQK